MKKTQSSVMSNVKDKIRTLDKEFMNTQESVQYEYSAFYGDYSLVRMVQTYKDGEITQTEGKLGLDYVSLSCKIAKEHALFMRAKVQGWLLDEYFDYTYSDTLEKLESRVFGLTRQEMLNAKVRNHIEKLYTHLYGEIVEIACSTYSATKLVAVRAQKSSFNLSERDSYKMGVKILEQEWLGDTLHNRLIQEKNRVLTSFSSLLSRYVTMDKPIEKINSFITREMKTRMRASHRIIQTEVMRLFNQAVIDACVMVEVKAIHVISSQNDSVCTPLQGVVVPVSEATVGVNIPPLHPNCLSYVTPVTEK